MKKSNDIKIPEEVKNIIDKLEEAGFQAYLVGGCVRDFLRGAETKDWDITTSARPQQIIEIFSDSVYENDFGTVLVKTDSDHHKLKIVEVTTFRIEGKYTDKRHPDDVRFADNIEDDLSRRDFTINAMAYDINKDLIIDPYAGTIDLKNKIIRTVGDPIKRFNEDALRLMRAVRFATELDFEIEEETKKAIRKEHGLLEMIAKERIRDEFIKIIMSPRAKEGIEMLEDLNLLNYIIPELQEGIGVGQNKHHIFSVWEHNLKALEYTAKKDYSLEVRIAALLHDVGKPKTKSGHGIDSTFHNHEVVGAKMAIKILDRLIFPKHIAEKIVHLVRYHLFYYNVGEVSEAGVRRFLRRVGPEYIDDLIKVREADRIGSGVPKAVPYKIRHLLFMIEKVKQDPISPKMLKIDGNKLMELLGIKPSPKVGNILFVLLEEVLDDPTKNNEKYLQNRAKELNSLNDNSLKELSEKAKETKEEFEQEAEGEIKKKFYV